MRIISAVKDSLLGIDLAFVRLKLGARVLVGLVLAVAALAVFSRLVHPIPIAGYALGIALSIQGVLVVRDSGAAAQTVTRIIGILVASVVLVLGALLAPYRIASDAAFLAVIFLAALARSAGPPRYTAIGMYAFMTYFMAAYFHPPLADVPFAIIGIVISAVVAQVVRFVVIPENRLRTLKGAVQAALQRADAILFDLGEISGRGRLEERDRRQLRRRVHRLKQAVLMAQGLLSGDETAAADPVVLDLQVNLVELQLAAESLIVSAGETRLPADLLLAGLGDLRHLAADAAPPVGTPSDAHRALDWLLSAKAALAKDIGAIRALPGPRPAAAGPGLSSMFERQALTTAVQVTLAAGIAMGFGLALSRERWFWAVISAFLVFVNTRSRGDTALRATQRALGTLFGIFVGLGIALVIGDWAVATGLLALVMVFFAFYSLPVSYARMTFFLSAALALVYGLFGVLTVELAWLRAEETVIGTLAGMLVSATVFPTRARVPLEAAVANYYAALRALLQVLDAASADEARMRQLAQDLDQAYSALVDAARPIGTPWQVVTRPGRVRQTLSLYLAATYWARLAARQVPVGDGAPDATAAAQILDRLVLLEARKAECFYIERDRSPLAPLRTVSRNPPAPDTTLSTLDATLARLYPEDR